MIEQFIVTRLTREQFHVEQLIVEQFLVTRLPPKMQVRTIFLVTRSIILVARFLLVHRSSISNT